MIRGLIILGLNYNSSRQTWVTKKDVEHRKQSYQETFFLKTESSEEYHSHIQDFQRESWSQDEY